MKKTNLKTGLTSEEIKTAKKNIVHDNLSKSYRSIFLQHTFTFFNIVNFILAALVFWTGSYRNMLFMGVVLSNMVIGIVQEIRSKKVLDHLALIHQEQELVLRNGKEETIPITQIVQGDLLILRAGDQIPCDGQIVEGSIECSEAMLTGESDSIEKEVGNRVLSGSFVISGKAMMQVEQVGEDTYIHSILKEAKRNKRYPSQLRDAIQTIIRICTFSIIPVGILLFVKQYFLSAQTLQETILSTVAALIGMIPEGLVILTSIALAISSMKLAKQNVLVQELYCTETLARVNILCLDKTGTITQGKMSVLDAEQIAPCDPKQIIANMYAALSDDNSTAQALREWADLQPNEKALSAKPFTSANKCAQVQFASGTFVCGAYTFMTDHPDPNIVAKIQESAKQGKRVLALAKKEDDQIEVLALINIQDRLRKDIRQVFQFFQKQDVQVKIISGDDPVTVAALANQAGVPGKGIDMSKVSAEELPEVVMHNSIFGRVKPEQKKAMILALKKAGNTVAMSGDGVNDVMALKEADCSIAMGSGSQAARSIASLILLNDQFEALPSILDQGRCVINNIQRTASLFLVKTIFSFILSILTIFVLQEYPFQPIQLTLISSLAIGFPSFVLTLEPDYHRVTGNFLRTVFSKAVPGALCVSLCVITTYIVQHFIPMNQAQFSTVCTLLAGVCSLCVLYKTCIPLTPLRFILVIVMSSIFTICVLFLKKVFFLTNLTTPLFILTLAETVCIPFFLWIFYVWIQEWNNARKKKREMKKPR